MASDLTKRNIEKMKPEPGKAQLDVYDSAEPGLVLRIGKKRKTWLFRYRVAGRKSAQVFTLGAYGDLDVKGARQAAALKRGEGGDPANERWRLRVAETVKDLASLYLVHHAAEHKKPKSAHEDAKMFNCDILPAWGPRKASEIRRSDVIGLLDEIVARGARVKANRVRALLSKLFNFANERSILESNPAQGVPRRIRELPRERCLNDGEIRTLWQTLDAFPSEKIADAYRLMLFTAQGEGEVLRMAWSEIDFESGWWTLPAERSKTNQMHRIPLTGTALDVLDRRKAAAGDSLYVFPGNWVKQPLRYVKRHAEIQTACKFKFQPRDLRRTAGTWVASTGVGRFIVARLLGHADRAITSVYDKYSYDDEKRRALERWDFRLKEIIAASESKVAQRRIGGEPAAA
ncbi:MAG TPA: tyrosine-type recombinase/integrase [Pyrinomonadaceae bacterium]|nr:tyrosine-type recombinase/integrase [Pyrinomonadaceae bacterium]